MSTFIRWYSWSYWANSRLNVEHPCQEWLHESVHFYGSVTMLDLLFTFLLGFSIGIIVLSFINVGNFVLSKVKNR